jgi:DNA helicase-2/ATP-dependent DNA helicase PcrA
LDNGNRQGKRTSAKDDPRFHSGQRVKHAKFGEGMVIESKLTGNDEEVTVAFSEGVKRLAASFANLEILD